LARIGRALPRRDGDELREPGDGGRHIGPALGDVHRLDIEPSLQLHYGIGVAGRMVGA
jgi:hypothetical protein